LTGFFFDLNIFDTKTRSVSGVQPILGAIAETKAQLMDNLFSIQSIIEPLFL
jgi:hypothetical protein